MSERTATYRPETDIVRPKPAPSQCRDLSSRDGAEQLAAERTEFWHSRGFTEYRANVVAVRLPGGRAKSANLHWIVVDNTVGGIPPRSRK